jgi:hypothetical protein
MALAFADANTIAKDAGWQGRLGYAMTIVAMNVYGEPPTTSGHPVRKAFAQLVFAGAYNVYSTGLMVLTDTAVSGAANIAAGTPGWGVTDAQIQAAVNNFWNEMAGV